MSAENYYKLLGVGPGASQAEIERRFQALAQAYAAVSRPSAEAERKFNAVLDAYATLKDPARRAAYDARAGVKRPAVNLRPPRRDWFRFWRKPESPFQPEEKPPTLSRLMDFDWSALEEPPPDSPHRRRAFRDELMFKVLVVAVVVGVIALVFWLARG